MPLSFFFFILQTPPCGFVASCETFIIVVKVFTTEFTELTELGFMFMFFIPAFPLCFSVFSVVMMTSHASGILPN